MSVEEFYENTSTQTTEYKRNYLQVFESLVDA